MIISPGRRYIFVHIPKTGGTTLARALEARAMADDILIGDTPKALRRRSRLRRLSARGRLWKHATLADIEGVLPEADLARLRAVALVRNPWDRAVSYYHWLRAQDFDHPAVPLARSLGFSEFLAHPRIGAGLRANPYGAYLRDSAGVERPCHWIRLEHLARDLAPFEAHLGFRLEMGHDNRSVRDSDWRGYYSPADRARLADLCAEDIARFGYRFDPD